MTESLLPPDMAQWMKPELVSPAVAWMCSEQCDANGEIIAATAAGYIASGRFFWNSGMFIWSCAAFRKALGEQRPDLLAVKELAETGRLSLDGLITHHGDPMDAAAAYRTAFGDPDCLKMVLDWRSTR